MAAGLPAESTTRAARTPRFARAVDDLLQYLVASPDVEGPDLALALTSTELPELGGAGGISTSVKVRLEYEILGEPFRLDFEQGSIIIHHPIWSLVGMGATLLDAEKDLLAEARELAEVLLRVRPTELDVNALQLRDFLFRVIG